MSRPCARRDERTGRLDGKVHYRAEERALAICAGARLHAERHRPYSRGGWTFDRRLVTCWFCVVELVRVEESAVHYSRNRRIAARACGATVGACVTSSEHVTCRACLVAHERDEAAARARSFLRSVEPGDVWIDAQAPHVPALPARAGMATRYGAGAIR